MLTSWGRREDAGHCHEIGCAAYLTSRFGIRSSGRAGLALTHHPEVAPTPPPSATHPPGGETSHRFAGRKARILLAEDNITNQMVALGILKQMGLRADAVANGAEALQALELLPYDLVLMDVQMPVMDGIEATQQIRRDEFIRWQAQCGNLQGAAAEAGRVPASFTLPIIAMTAHALQGDRERCLEAGMNDYVTKPVARQALAAALGQWLPHDTEERTLVTDDGGPGSDAVSGPAT
ncbi:MAG: response regulator [Chromatiaceae bacterium]|nr:response regulator [Chromatiaceae bacterium]